MRSCLLSLSLVLPSAAIAALAPGARLQGDPYWEKAKLVSEVKGAQAAFVRSGSQDQGIAAELRGLALRASMADNYYLIREVRHELWSVTDRLRWAQRHAPVRPAGGGVVLTAEQERTRREVAARDARRQEQARARALAVAGPGPSAAERALVRQAAAAVQRPVQRVVVPSPVGYVVSRGGDAAFAARVERIGREEGVDPKLLLNMARKETHWNASVDCAPNGSGAIGRMQVKFATARAYGVTHWRQLCDEDINIRVAARHLKAVTPAGVQLARVDRLTPGVRKGILLYYLGHGNYQQALAGSRNYWVRWNWDHAHNVYVPTIERWFNQMAGALYAGPTLA